MTPPILAKLFDGVFFFLIFKLCQFLWERVLPYPDEYENQPEPAKHEDEPAPDYENLPALLNNPVTPVLGSEDEEEEPMRWII